MRLAIDAMGGDEAPAAIVAGALDYARRNPAVHTVLVGQQEPIYRCLSTSGTTPENISVHDAPDVIGMGDKITALREKPGDSMNACSRLLKEGKVDAIVLCGNTGCSVAAAQLHLGRIPGVKRAGILTPLPNVKKTTWVIDCGANSTAKPEYLVQWAEMGAAFLSCYDNVSRPRVGVLSIGTEEGKGDDLTAKAHELLKQTDLNLIGLVEGNNIFNGTVDVVVCDGFTGNVVLKSAEGVASAISHILKEGIYASLRAKIGAWFMKPAFDTLRQRTHWSEVGGALLAGVNGVVIIGHGRSNATAVSNALSQAERCVEGKLIDAIKAQLEHGKESSGRRGSFIDTVKKMFTGGDDPSPDEHSKESVSQKATDRIENT